MKTFQIFDKPIALSKRQAVSILGNSKTLFEKAVRAGKIRPVIHGCRGKASLYDAEEVCTFWNSLKSERGFTLVELLGVIAIIAVIAAVAITSINGAFAASRDSAIERRVQTLNQQLANWHAAGGAYSGWFNSASAGSRAWMLYSAMCGGGVLSQRPDLGGAVDPNHPAGASGTGSLVFIIEDGSFWDSGMSMINGAGERVYLTWYPTSGFHFEPAETAYLPSDAPHLGFGNFGNPTDPHIN